MASSVYKWLIIPFLGVLFYAGTPRMPHPFHVSVVEVNHNATDKTLEISCKMFTDDFERILAKNYKTKVDLINPSDRKATDKLVSDYIKTHLQLTANGRAVQFSYLGFEREDDAIYSFVEVTDIASLNQLGVVNQLMYDLFDDQTNLIHVTFNGSRKSTKLEYPNKEASFSF
jgi:hypothetical protein